MPAPALGASATGHRLSLVLGVMTAPGATRNRDNLRALSHRPHAHGVRTVFVLGDVDCARRPTAAEHIAHRDFVFVNASDCQTWHRAAKVDAWYRHALARWPSAHWIGKSEDDALVRVSALARDLAALDATQPWYYGIMAWIGLCDSEAAAYTQQHSHSTHSTTRPPHFPTSPLTSLRRPPATLLRPAAAWAPASPGRCSASTQTAARACRAGAL